VISLSCRDFRRIVCCLSLFVLFSSVYAANGQWNPPNPVTGFTQIADGIEVHQTAGVLRVQVTAPGILHITYGPESGTLEHASDGVLAKRDWPAAQFAVESDDKTITLTTAQVKAVIDRTSGALTYKTPAGQTLTTDSYRQLIPADVNGEKTSHAEVFFAIYGSKEGLYGLGQHQAGVWNYRGETVDLSQENTNIAIPLLVSSNGYGIFWNNPSRSRVNNRFIHMLYLSAEVADKVDYYFLAGPEPDSIVAHYRELTGDAPMFGRWAYGFWQCKNKYESQAELEAVAAKYRALHIPVDNIVQDWFWWVTMGEMKWNPKYPDPQGLINDLHDKHFHLMVSIWPYFRPGSKEYDAMDKNGWFVAKTQVGGFHPLGQALYDPTNPAARKYYWDNANAALFRKGARNGVDAWWLDTDEPETEGREENILLDHQIALGSGARYANIFPNFHTEGVADGQRAASDKKRVFILSRSAYAGSQRNGVTAWSGDVLSDFVTFQRQISAGLNYAISGMPYWTTDIGGFISGGDLNDPKFRELFVRWFQFGAFSPIFRVHGQRERALVVWAWCGQNSRGLRHAALPADAVHLLAGMAGDQRARHAHASAGDGLANGRAGAEYRRRISVWAVDPGESGLYSRRDQPQRLSAEGNLVRLLDRRKAGGRTDDSGCGASRKAAALRAGWFNLATRPDDGVDHRKSGRPDRIAHLSRRRWRLYAL